MDPRTQERVEEWDSRPFNGGFDGLSDLAHADFSGAVSAAGTWLFLLNGRVVGVIDGDIEDFETVSGTCYEAPHPSLPLLCTMEEQGGETRAKYYTNETPLREVDDTLQSGSFTGYVELSENVLSGDYYAVYYGGRRMAAAYIGNAERLLTGEEAFERAADEVGIYEVIDVEIDVVDVPGTGDSASETESTTESPPSDAAVDAGAPSAATDDDSEPDTTGSSIEPIDVSSTDAVDSARTAGTESVEDATDDEPSALSSEIDLTDDPSGITATDSSETETESPSAGITESAPTDDSGPASASEPSAVDETPQTPDRDAPTEPDSSGQSEADAVSTEAIDSEPASTAEAPVAEEPSTDEPSTVDADPESTSNPDLAEIEAAAEELDRNDISWVDDDGEPSTGSASDGSVTESGAATEDEGLEEEFEREAEWRETRRIPSIDPENSDSESDSSTGGRELRMDQPSTSSDASTAASPSNTARSDASSTERTATATASAGGTSESRTDHSQTQEPPRSGGDAATADTQRERVSALTEKVETLQEQRDTLATKAEELETERDRLRAENDDLSATIDRLQSRIDDLETELEQARTREADDAKAGTSASTQLSPQQALSQTNLFVRYASKSQPTLETAHGGDADRSEVASNLRLEHHTGFDSSDTAVDGQSYDEFLETTMEYRFVDWLTEMLLYEIRDTGNANGLGDLYDAIPRIDRAELGATISLADDDTEDVPEQVTFDIVAFDKMGNPLLLVTLNDSREPATKDLLAELEEAASAVKANYPDLAAAIAVTSSYFEPGALEVAEQATSSGFLSRSSKLSYVNLSRKSGYHLCLVESRSEGFHMNVPEL
ncbi:transcriptional regulator [Haloarchaeobius amylolyticus]|uniref:Transcriptional regulator n=1 Tax=Haloarchaeobius amylolyticus TaxID=1198296 RepID=A0ABD6BHR4_9EURY